MGKREEIAVLFPGALREFIESCSLDFESMREIRLRAGRPVLLMYGNREYGFTEKGEPVELEPDNQKGLFTLTERQIRETAEIMGGFSLYAAQEELRQGFFTVRGGHRIGVAGRTVLNQREVGVLKSISSLNVRVAHEVKGCADQIMPLLCENGLFLNTVIVSPPGCGKTTLLRDIIRQLSNGCREKSTGRRLFGITVGVVDERSELGACFQGIPQNDLGMRTDILDGCPKSQGMMMLIRSMAPAVIAVDEIGGKEDIRAVEYIRSCGCGLAAAVHGVSLKEVEKRPGVGELFKEGTFKRLIFLDQAGGAGHICAVYDEAGMWLAWRWRARLEALETLRQMIFGLKGEITYSRAPLEEALERVGRRENGFLGRLFTGAAREIAASREETFSKIWEKQVELIKKGPQGEILDEKDIKQLAGLGGRLGYLDVDMQERTLLLYLEQLELSISRLRGEMRERCRLSTALGMMGSLLLVILMY